jgi:hypothetical protein
MKIGSVLKAQCVYSIKCDCDRCYFGKTSRHLAEHIKEHKHNLTQRVFEEIKISQTYTMKKATKYVVKNGGSPG